MLSRRDFFQVAAAAAVLTGAPGRLTRAAARQLITQKKLLKFDPVGQVTLLHFADLHAQLLPIYFREPSVNIGVGAGRGRFPHLTGRAFLDRFGIAAGSPQAYALTSEEFVALARAYGKLGGSTGWPPWSRRFAPSARARLFCSTAATPGRVRTARWRPPAPTWWRS